MEKREAAYVLFMDGVSQVDISRLLKVSEPTLVKWVRDGGWKSKRIESDLFERTSTENIQELILYQLEVIRLKTKRMRAEAKYLQLDYDGTWIEIADADPANAEAGGWVLDLKPIQQADVAGLQKLYSTIKKAELRWDEAVRLMRRFVDYLQTHDLAAAKSITAHADDFLNEIRKQMNR